jgi:hypothetical protein
VSKRLGSITQGALAALGEGQTQIACSKTSGGGGLEAVAATNFNSVMTITENFSRFGKIVVWLGGQQFGDLMLRYVAFFVLGSAFATSIVTTVQTHRLSIEPRVLLAKTPVNYVDDNWPPPVPVSLRASSSQ